MFKTFLAVWLAALFLPVVAGAHAPFLESDDFTPSVPFVMAGSVEKSIAVYAALVPAQDVDVYTFTVVEGERVQANLLVPQCVEYETFFPAIALVGPGLSEPDEDLPLDLPAGYGAQVQRGFDPAGPDTFYEPFSAKSYYRFPKLIVEDARPGAWQAWVWDPDNASVDYVFAPGFRERFTLWDILRTLFILPLLWFDGELNGPCTAP